MNSGLIDFYIRDALLGRLYKIHTSLVLKVVNGSRNVGSILGAMLYFNP